MLKNLMKKYPNINDLSESYDELLVDLIDNNNREKLIRYYKEIHFQLSELMTYPIEFPLLCFVTIRKIIDNNRQTLIDDFETINFVMRYLIFYEDALLVYNYLKLPDIDVEAHICDIFANYWINKYRRA